MNLSVLPSIVSHTSDSRSLLISSSSEDESQGDVDESSENMLQLTAEVQEFVNGLRSFADGAGTRLEAAAVDTARSLTQTGSSSYWESRLGFFGRTLDKLASMDPELAESYLAFADLFVDHEEGSALDRFLAAVYEALGSKEAGAKVGGVFEDALARLSSSHEISVEVSVRIRAQLGAETEAEEGDPLVLDLDGDGRADRTSFASGGDAFLALDRNGNGRIDSGRELFGDHHGLAHGFEELSRFDANGDGRIDRSDPVYERLSLVRSSNGQITQSDLNSAGVGAIELDYSNVNESLESGDRLAQKGGFVRADGSRGTAADAVVKFLDLEA